MTSANDPDQQPEGINKGRLVGFLLALPVYFALFMFLPAGTWAWTKGWLFIGVFLGTLAVVALYLWRVNPEVVVARTGFHEGTKRWDKILLRFFFRRCMPSFPWRRWTTGGFIGFRCPGGSVASVMFCSLPAWGSSPGRKPSTSSSRSRFAFKRNEVTRSSTPAPTPSCVIPVMSPVSSFAWASPCAWVRCGR